MVNFTSNTYQMKPEILTFSNKISKHLSKPDKKFSAEMTYGMLASGSCLLTDVVDQIHESTKKVNSVERLTRHLNNGTSSTALKSYLTAKRKLFFHGKWVPATQLRNQRKGKIKTVLTYKGKKHVAYLSHVKVQITASKKDIYLVLVYGITEHPMMLAINKKIQSKEDVVNIAMTYFSRWRIEEYFRCKKQMFQFENFRVRKLAAINALNFYITLCMAFLTHISMK